MGVSWPEQRDSMGDTGCHQCRCACSQMLLPLLLCRCRCADKKDNIRNMSVIAHVDHGEQPARCDCCTHPLLAAALRHQRSTAACRLS